MQNNHLKIQKTARYFTHGDLSETTKNIWFVCHGYGQLAEYFIKNFALLSPEENFVVAPEALSRCYLRGFQGRVGAVWMTKEDREAEIEDYIYYLNSLYHHVMHPKKVDISQVKIWIVGFSQGVATTSRWLFDGQVRFDYWLMWAGGIAHDLDFSKTEKVLKDKEVHMVYGLQDDLIEKSHFEAQMNLLMRRNFRPVITTFEGKHEIPGKALREVITKVEKS